MIYIFSRQQNEFSISISKKKYFPPIMTHYNETTEETRKKIRITFNCYLIIFNLIVSATRLIVLNGIYAHWKYTLKIFYRWRRSEIKVALFTGLFIKYIKLNKEGLHRHTLSYHLLHMITIFYIVCFQNKQRPYRGLVRSGMSV